MQRGKNPEEANPPKQGTADEHWTMAGENLALFAQGNLPDRWRLTTVFYAALHVATAVAADRGVKLNSHSHREGWLLGVASKPGRALSVLRSHSLISRYQPGFFPYRPGQVRPGGLFHKKYNVVAYWAAGELKKTPLLVKPPAA